MQLRGAGSVRSGSGLLHVLYDGSERLPPSAKLQHDPRLSGHDYERTESEDVSDHSRARRSHDAAGGLRASADEAWPPGGGLVYDLSELPSRSSVCDHRKVPEAVSAERGREGNHRAERLRAGSGGSASQAARDQRVSAAAVHGHARESGETGKVRW